MRRRTIQLAKTDPRASHLTISQGVGSIHAPFSRSLYTIRIQGCTPSQANIYIYIYTVRYEGKEEEGVERNVRTRHISKSVRSNLSRFDDGESKLPQIETEDERIERSEWMGLKGYERASNREKLSRIARTLGRVISEYRRGEVGSRASERASRAGIRSEFDKNSLDFSRRSRGSNAVSVNFSRPGSLKYERRESARRYGTYGETLNGT